MGPQPFGCGRSEALQPIRDVQMLQWGRNLSVAEGPRPAAARPSAWRFNGAATFRLRKVSDPCMECMKAIELQWGRNLSVAEGW